MRKPALICALLACALSTGAQEAIPPIFGEMRPGPHAVGFRIMELRDESRPVRSKKNYYGEVDSSDRSRVIAVHLWYPAAPSSAARMTYGDVMDTTQPEAQRVAGRAARRTFMDPRFGRVTDEAWERLLNSPLLAVRDAAPAAGKFPLLLGTLRPLSTELTNEYLASHGYVVAMTFAAPSQLARNYSQNMEMLVRDLEFTWAHLRKQPMVDGSRLGLYGFSGAGFAQFLMAMRNPDVDAIADLESAIFGIPDFFNSYGYDPKALRIPFLHTYSVSVAKLDKYLDEFDKMKFSQRFHFLVDPPQNDHWDFATEGMAANTVLGLRPQAAPLLRKSFEMTNLYLLNFFNAFIKGDAAGLAFLRRDTSANGAPEKLVTMRELPGLRAAPGAADLNLIAEREGIAQAMKVFTEGHRNEPDARIFTEQQVNALAYALLNQGKLREALEFFKWNAQSYPASANAQDSLAEAYERAGELALARKSSEAAMAAAETQPGLQDARRAELKELQLRRLERLRARQ